MTVAGEVYERLRSAEWLAAFGGILVLIVWLLRLGVGKVLPWVNTKPGGFVLALTTSLLLSFGTALQAGQPMSFGLATLALGAAWVAAGGWGHAKDLLTWAQAKAGIG